MLCKSTACNISLGWSEFSRSSLTLYHKDKKHKIVKKLSAMQRIAIFFSFFFKVLFWGKTQIFSHQQKRETLSRKYFIEHLFFRTSEKVQTKPYFGYCNAHHISAFNALQCWMMLVKFYPFSHYSKSRLNPLI